ncbi:DUF2007 domain-containing protein [Bacteroidales bacterium OttesenSCG-928-K03]|nr:DUF2007 domain-containing protein [Odoribacter sp. OttesenSCG-928-L07]MDL2240148.1 DUF2007 domain-containing protein [Bacteroidales bacterium OttesenSCG-928-K22]MDL2242972.1 DUF2007 domain-containing protein [Bacteroidales bacterium OttesenSCG-928-K03]
MEETIKLVYTTDKEYQANIILALLEESNIKGNIINKQDTAYKTFGDIELYVNEKDYDKAKEIVDQANL